MIAVEAVYLDKTSATCFTLIHANSIGHFLHRFDICDELLDLQRQGHLPQFGQGTPHCSILERAVRCAFSMILCTFTWHITTDLRARAVASRTFRYRLVTDT